MARRRGLPDAPDVDEEVVDRCAAGGRCGVAAAAYPFRPQTAAALLAPPQPPAAELAAPPRPPSMVDGVGYGGGGGGNDPRGVPEGSGGVRHAAAAAVATACKCRESGSSDRRWTSRACSSCGEVGGVAAAPQRSSSRAKRARRGEEISQTKEQAVG